MRKIIKIFLGSSLTEFANERMDIENFIRNISDKFEENYDIKIQPLLCENFDDAYSKIRKQEEYNEKIRNSDFCFFIFFTKAGQYTREEFEVAIKKFEETGTPKVYTYFKVLGEQKAEDSLVSFMEELDKVFGHYYGTFDHIDTVKLRILLNLKMQEMDFIEIKVDGDACMVDGKKALSLENVSEFANNSVFGELKAQLEAVEEQYYKLKAKYVEGVCLESEEREYINIATKRQTLIKQIEEIRNNIFNLSLRMCKDEAMGEITPRQKEAYRFFEAGDLEAANRILDFGEIKNDYLRRKAIREAEQKRDAQIFIREGRTKIDILYMMNSLSTRFEEIEEIYDEITAVAFEEEVEIHTVNDFVWFLYRQNNHPKAYEIAKRLEETISNQEEKIASDVYYMLGAICADYTPKITEAEEYYKKSIAIYEKLAEENSQVYMANLAIVYNGVSIFYKNQGKPQKAEEYNTKAIAIYESLVKTNPEKFNSGLAIGYNNAGIFYAAQGEYLKAEQYYLKAIAIKEKLAETNPEEFSPDLAHSYNNAALFYNDQGQPQKAEEYYIKAIAVYEKFVEINPERFNSDLAMSYNNIGNFYRGQGQKDKTEVYYAKATALYKKLAEINPEKFSVSLAMSYNNTGIFYEKQGKFDMAEDYFMKALVLYEKQAESNPQRFGYALAMSYNNVGSLWAKQEKPQEAEQYYIKAIAIYENIAKNNPERFNPDLANCYNNIGAFYRTQWKMKEAEQYYIKALTLREKLAENNPAKFNADLANSYNSLAIFYDFAGKTRKAEKYYIEAITIREALAKNNPERFNYNLAVSYNNAGAFYKKQGQIGKTAEYYTKAIAIREELVKINPERFTPDLATSYFNYALLSKDNRYSKRALALANAYPENPICQRIIEVLSK